MRRTRLAWGLAFLALALTATLAQAWQGWQAGSDGLVPIPALRERVTDLTQTLSAQETQALVAKLAAWEAKTGNQLAVLLVPTTQPESIEAYGIRVADAWKIGRKGRDNGALLIVAKNDRKLRIEVGYGFEGTLTDAVSRRIIGDVIAPYFRQNQFGKGVEAGVDAIMATIDKDPGAVAPTAAKAPPAHDAGDVPVVLLFVLFVIVPALGGMLRRMFGTAFGTILGSGLAGVGTGLVLGSVIFGIVAAVLALVVLLFTAGMGSGLASRGGGVWLPPGGWRGGGGGWGGGGGGGGFSGGGGGFGGGGASGSW